SLEPRCKKRHDQSPSDASLFQKRLCPGDLETGVLYIDFRKCLIWRTVPGRCVFGTGKERLHAIALDYPHFPRMLRAKFDCAKRVRRCVGSELLPRSSDCIGLPKWT